MNKHSLIQLIPDLTRLPFDKAKKIMALHGFTLGGICFQDHPEWSQENMVLAQFPQAGEPRGQNKKINLTLLQRSFVNYLPDIFQQEDLRVGGLLKRYLWIFQHMLESQQTILNQLPCYFNPYSTTREFLPWLASWIAVELNEGWPEEKRRAFLAAAVDIYKQRGTKAGLKQCLAILADAEVDIEEYHLAVQPFYLNGNTAIGVNTILLPPPRLEHCFTVHLPDERKAYSQTMIMKIHRVIESEKPGHTEYFLAFGKKQCVYQELIPWVLGEQMLSKAWLN